MEAKPLILIVDDDKNTREGLGRALQGTYEVLLADGGARALDLLAAHPVRVMISDMRMSGMDGLTLLQRALAGGVVCHLLQSAIERAAVLGHRFVIAGTRCAQL